MTDPARIIDPPLPAALADAMESAGLSPEIATLMQIIENFARLKAEAREKPRASEQMWPLKARLPLHVPYETARKAAVLGDLVATKMGRGRWFVADHDLQNWLASTGRVRRG